MNALGNSILTILAAIAVITFGGTAGCGSSSIRQNADGNFSLGKFYSEKKEIKIGGSKFFIDEGFIIVNENPDDKNSRRIQLPVTRIRSSNKNPLQPVFWFNGGPGMTNMKYEPDESLLLNHDVVLVGYRGVDGSIKLDAPEITKAMKGDGDDLLGNNSMKMMTDAIDSFSIRMKREKIDLNFYTILEVISDFETARKALRYDKINLLSASYGTRVALLYSYLRPDFINRSVMVGANPPGRFLWEPKKIDDQLSVYDSLYSEFGKRKNISLTKTMKTVLENLPNRWSIFKLDAGKIKTASFAMLYHRESSALAFDAFIKASEDDFSGLYMLQRVYDFVIPSMMTWGDFFAKGLSADFDSSVNYKNILSDSSTIMGSPLSYLIWRSEPKIFSVRSISKELRVARDSNTETLIVSGNLDFSTPAEYAAEELLPKLKNGKQIVLKDLGHVDDLMNRQPEAFSHLLNEYFGKGIADDSKFVYQPMDFNPPVDLSFWAKALYPFVAIASLF